MAVRQLIFDFSRVWEGVWVEARRSAMESLGAPPYPKISVIFLIRDGDTNIERSLFSVLDQDINNLEVICIFFGTAAKQVFQLIQDVCARDKRVRLVTSHQLNGSKCKGWKFAILEAQGQFVLFLEPGFILEEKALSHLYGVAQDTCSDVVVGRAQVITGLDKRAFKELDQRYGISENDSLNYVDLRECDFSELAGSGYNCIYDLGLAQAVASLNYEPPDMNNKKFLTDLLRIATKLTLSKNITATHLDRSFRKTSQIKEGMNSL
jgi:hypothetical protein